MFALMTIKELYRNSLLQLQSVYPLSEATVITDWTFESIAGIKRADLVKNPSQQLNNKIIEQLNNSFSQLLQYKPVQYVLGEAWFYHLKLKVNEDVLIPRPETEELVELVIANRRSQITDPAILDIGTGSGCIAIAIKKNLPAAIVSAIDVSENALNIGKENAARCNARINFIQLDFLDETKWDKLSMFHIIISNPPYIPVNEKRKLARHVLDYEPHIALFVPDKDPLVFYEKIASFGRSHLHSNGRIYLETHEDHAKEVKVLFNKDYAYAEIKKDLFGKERIVIVSL
jgi:release factor glutamine methyltransferase